MRIPRDPPQAEVTEGDGTFSTRTPANPWHIDNENLQLGLSVRQVRRIRRRVGAGGRAGLQHGNRGQVPVNKLRAAVRARILRLRRDRYRDFNDVHFVNSQ